MKDEECMCRDCLNAGSSLSSLAKFSFAILCIMTYRAYLRLSSRPPVQVWYTLQGRIRGGGGAPPKIGNKYDFLA
jgi:hypothetical protein